MKALFYLAADSPVPYKITLHEPSSVYMEGLHVFNNQLLVIITVIVVLVGWFMAATLLTTIEYCNSFSNAAFAHSNRLEIGWTSTPVLVLLSLASPSFSLLFSMDEVSEPDLTVKIFGHQWYWSYEMSDFNSCSSTQNLRYTAYMMTQENLIENNLQGLFRNLETTRRLVLPTNTHVRLLITSVDVLHSWAVPSLGIKVDACPGRLNLISLFIKRIGLFFGQCSEICGVNHGFMPISVIAVPSNKFYALILSEIKKG